VLAGCANSVYDPVLTWLVTTVFFPDQLILAPRSSQRARTAADAVMV